jgi:hypothetical protein
MDEGFGNLSLTEPFNQKFKAAAVGCDRGQEWAQRE